MWEQVAEGTQSELYNLGVYEDRIGEGERGRLRLNLRWAPPSSEVAKLDEALKLQKVAEANVSASGNTIEITWRKGFPWLAVIAIAIISLIILAALIVTWLIFKEVTPSLQPWLIAGGILGMLLIAYIVYKVRI